MLDLSLKGLFICIPITYALGGIFPTNKRFEESYSSDILYFKLNGFLKL